MMTFEMKEKMTKKDWFAILGEIVESAELDEEVRVGLGEFISHEEELLSKKRSSSSKTSKETERLMSEILMVFAEDSTPVKVTQFLQAHPLETDKGEVISSQKLSALFKKLVDGGKLQRIKEKKDSFFTLA